jgi:selenide,water dikinase
VRWMCELNAATAHAMLKYEVHAATDITGFGLIGHAAKMAEGSDVTLHLEESDLPLMAGALECCRAGMIPGGGKRNREFYGPRVRISDEVADEIGELVFDPQTSGGLFIALPENDAMKLLVDLQAGGNTDAAIVGRVLARGEFLIEVV